MLSAGTKLGPYEILAPLGAGGMGEVYRARDTRLNRDVALKMLPEAFAADPERLARFTREAQTLAALNHPHIAQIHGLEEAGAVRALVMELVDGEDLAHRIAHGPIPLDEALPIARQIADALEAAHEKGIIHRDLKPANIMVTADSLVKVLDFGLAKLEPGGSSASGGPGGLTHSPTLTFNATQDGVVLGTAAYMSPEQAKGRVADKRSDVWAFGCVLFEMLTAKRAFEGEDLTDTIAAVMRGEPDWTRVPSDVPPHIVTLIRRCLEKDRKARIGDIAVARFVLTEPAMRPGVGSTGSALQVAPQPAGWRVALPWAVTAGAVVVATSVVGLWAPWRAVPAPRPMRFAIAPTGAGQIATTSTQRDLALSPDGAQLVYVTGVRRAESALWVRAFDQLDAVELRGPTAPDGPFISPDSKWIGFVSGSELKKIPMTGGPPIAVCRIQGNLRGASWGPNDTIVFATSNTSTGLLSVPADGGEPKVLTTPDPDHSELDHLFPSVLPDGRAVLFTITTASGLDNAQVAALDLKTGQRKTLIRGGSHAEYVDPSTGSGEAGYLIYAARGTLRAVRFDPVRLEVWGDPVPVVAPVMTKGSGAAEFSVSRHGALVYVPGALIGGEEAQRSLVWVNRQGREEPIKAPPRAYLVPRLSPDGARIALDIRDQDSDIWTWDVAHETLTRITKDPAMDSNPVWTPDGRRILFASGRNGVTNLYWQSADGTGSAERLATSPNGQFPLSISPDGTQAVVREMTPNGTIDLFLLHLDGPSTSLGTGKRAIEPLIQTPFNEDNGVISPDGRWLAYESNESGQYEIYVRPFPNTNDALRQVSSGGGRAPLWSPNGRELFYLDGNLSLMTVPMQLSTTFSFGVPTKLFDANTGYRNATSRTYDVSRDGQKFLMTRNAQPADQKSASMVVVLNWFEDLKARLPAQ